MIQVDKDPNLLIRMANLDLRHLPRRSQTDQLAVVLRDDVFRHLPTISPISSPLPSPRTLRSRTHGPQSVTHTKPGRAFYRYGNKSSLRDRLGDRK